MRSAFDQWSEAIGPGRKKSERDQIHRRKCSGLNGSGLPLKRGYPIAARSSTPLPFPDPPLAQVRSPVEHQVVGEALHPPGRRAVVPYHPLPPIGGVSGAVQGGEFDYAFA